MNVIEETAFRYFEFAGTPGYNLLAICLAAAVTGFFKPVDSLMQRGTYFLNAALIAFLASIFQMIWLLSVDAIVSGYLALIVLLDLCIWYATGYFYVLISKARSNDAYGTSRYAILSFIPIANLWLLFSPSQTKLAPQLPLYLSGGRAVALGIVISIFTRLVSVGLEQAILSNTHRASAEEATLMRGKYFSFYAQTDGIEAALNFLKSIETVGQRIDEITFREAVVVKENTLIYRLRITDETVTSIDADWANQVRSQMCSEFEFVRQQGGKIILEYFSNTQGTLLEIAASDKTC